MKKKQKPISIEQIIAQGELMLDAYEELMPLVQELMLGRELSKIQGAVVLSMVITSFYEGDDLDKFITTLEHASEVKKYFIGRKK